MSHKLRHAFSIFLPAIFACTMLHAAELPGKAGKSVNSTDKKDASVEMTGQSVPPAVDYCDKLFCKLDKNHDYHLGKKEFVDGKLWIDKRKTVKLFPDMRDIEHMNDMALKESLFDRIDRNHDGVLSREEWFRIAPNILEIRF